VQLEVQVVVGQDQLLQVLQEDQVIHLLLVHLKVTMVEVEVLIIKDKLVVAVALLLQVLVLVELLQVMEVQV
tara:strand:- start:249 stop:464 length:216 start_codon:yes stop_codon:yes gene_type:complete